MIREYLGKKAAESIDRSKYGDTKIGKVASTILDEERVEEYGFEGLGSIRSGPGHSSSRYRILLYGAAVNATSWLAVLLIPTVVSKLVIGFSLIFSKGGLLLVTPSLGFTLYSVYFLLRVWFPEQNDAADASDVMQSYERQSDSLLTWKLWVISCGVGGVNAIFLVVTYLKMSGEW